MAEESKTVAKRYYIGKVQKLSGWQWSYHDRVLKVEDNVLSYYSKVPKDFSGIFTRTSSLDFNKYIPLNTWPKESIFLDHTVVSAVTAEDKAKSKKLDLDRSFKVIFNANCVVGATQAKLPKRLTWFFSLDKPDERDRWVNT